MDQRLSTNRVLANLPAEMAMTLAPHLTSIELNQGDRLLQAGKPVEQIVFPLSGVVSIQVTVSSGIAVETAVIGREGVVGAASASLPQALNDAVVRVPGTAQALPMVRFADALKQSPVLAEHIARSTASLLAQAQQTAACNATHTAEARICRWLLDLQDRCDDDVIPVTQECLSEMLGLQRTTVTLIASRLQSLEAIRCRRGKIRVLNRAPLEHGACECYGRMLRYSKELYPTQAAPVPAATAVA